MVSTPSRLSASRITRAAFILSSSAVDVNGREREPDAVAVISRKRFAATQYRSGLGPGDEGYIAAQHARILPSRALPRRFPPYQLVVADLQGEGARGDVDADHVPVLDKSYWTSIQRLRSDVAYARPPAGPAEAAVGDERHARIQTSACQSRSGCEH